MRLFKTISTFSMSMMGNALLLTAALLVALCGLAMTATTLIRYVEETPPLIQLQCFIGFERADCPEYGAELDALRGQKTAIEDALRQAEAKLAGLAAVERAVDEINLFENFNAPDGQTVTVGTVYTALTNPNPRPEYHFCYLNLPAGDFGENRNLHFHGRLGPTPVSASELGHAGISEETLAYARSVCQPLLIGS